MPAAPTVTYVDDANGTSVTATIAGSDAGSSNAVLISNWTGGFINPPYASVATRVGDGTVSVPATPGMYFSVVRSTLSGVALSLPGGFRATDGVDAIHYQCCEAVQAFIQALALTGISSDKVLIRKFPRNRDAMAVGCYITPLRETRAPVDTGRDEMGYRVQVTLVQASDGDLTSNLATELLWRQRITLGMSEKPLTGVEEIHSVIVDPGPVVIPSAFLQQYDISVILLRCECQLDRSVS